MNAFDATGTGTPQPGGPNLAAAIIERWRFIVAVVCIAVVITVVALVVRGTRYEATVTLSTVSTMRSLPAAAGGGIASLLNLGGTAGLQSTPVLIVRIARSQSVILSVAADSVPGDSVRLIERLTRKSANSLSTRDIIGRVNRVVSASYDRESGLVTLRAVHRDSALARAIVQFTVANLQRVFIQASRSQATELRRAQEARLDSAESQLRTAERTLSSFLSANRVITPYSPLQAEFQRLQRAVDIAQTVYLQVRTEREAAIGKELEETPAVVVVDALPAVLPTVSAQALTVVLAVVIAALIVALLLIAVLEWSRDPVDGSRGTRDRLVRAVARLPIVGQMASRLLEPPASGS